MTCRSCSRSSPALKIRLVAGYAANSDILLAVERKEADAYSALATTIQLAVDRGAVRPLVRSRTPVPGWNHLPTDESLATNDTGRALMAIRGIPQSIGRAFAVRPGTPPERVAMLREALAKTLKDPDVPGRGGEGEDRDGLHLGRERHQVVRRPPEPAAAGAGGDEQVPQGRRISSIRIGTGAAHPRLRTPLRPENCNDKQSNDKKHGEEFMRRVRWSGLLACCLIASLRFAGGTRAGRLLQGQDHHHRRGHAGRRLDRQHLAASSAVTSDDSSRAIRPSSSGRCPAAPISTPPTMSTTSRTPTA